MFLIILCACMTNWRLPIVAEFTAQFWVYQLLGLESCFWRVYTPFPQHPEQVSLWYEEVTWIGQFRCIVWKFGVTCHLKIAKKSTIWEICVPQFQSLWLQLSQWNFVQQTTLPWLYDCEKTGTGKCEFLIKRLKLVMWQVSTCFSVLNHFKCRRKLGVLMIAESRFEYGFENELKF
jgi:hypothetical protein